MELKKHQKVAGQPNRLANEAMMLRPKLGLFLGKDDVMKPI